MSTNGEKEAVAQVGLKREIGLPSAISMILAVMIGSGIFITPSTALQETGSIGFCLVVWVVSGVLSLLGALAFAELSAVVPRSGAEYAYFVEAFSPLHRYLGQLPAFICSWVFVFILRPAEVAVITLTFAEYFVQPFRGYIGEIDEETYGYVKKMIAILALGLMVYINVISVKLYVKVQNICTACKVAACFLVIGGGIFWLAMGHTELLSEPFKGTNTAPGNIALAFYSGLWAYDGWTASAIVAEEVKRPEINILRSILVAVPVITVLYVSMNVMYMSALTVPEMINAQAVAIAWGDVVLPGWLTYAIPFGVAVSTFGCGLSIQFGVARLCYVAGQEGHVPRFFSWVHYEHMTPAAAVVLQGLLTLVCMVSGSIAELIELASFLIWAFYGLAMVALLVMRHTKPHAPRPYRVPTIIPCIVLAVSVFLSVTPMIAFPTYRYLFIACFMLVGYVIYHYYVYEKKKSKFSRKLTYLVQMLFMVVAPDEDDSTSGSCATSSEDQTASAEKEKLAIEDEIAAR